MYVNSVVAVWSLHSVKENEETHCANYQLACYDTDGVMDKLHAQFGLLNGFSSMQIILSFNKPACIFAFILDEDDVDQH